ncbi:unnamed protein product [Mytilus edulis]|uniref:Uncharacterized protein n=1 Tax=Mytilus edulis TaxID=6550 RepID=A0A8S3TCR8_MYTED|nr:unnamed protein product [Mytilus edulis]
MCNLCPQPSVPSVQVTSMLSLQCNLCPQPSVPSVQVTSMLSLQCVTYVLNLLSIISTSNKYVIITMCNLCPKPSVPSVQVTSMLSLQCNLCPKPSVSSVQVTSMLSLQCVTYVLQPSSIISVTYVKPSVIKYVIITMCNLCPQPSVSSVQVINIISTSNKYVIITMCNLCPKPSVSSVQVTSMLSLQCVTYVLKPSVPSVQVKSMLSLQCNLCPKPSVPSVQVTIPSSVQVTSMLSLQCVNLCPKPSVSSVQVTTPSPNGYVLLMKGVTGVGTYPPGVTDLFGLWNSTKTINEFNLEAQSMTPNFPGHYKPISSNNWTGLCLDKVRVSIYKNGVEKAFMLFNATGADKMSWFTPSRIIDSSWVDLQSSTKQYFAMSQDPDFLREFYASQNADKSKCDSTGWMFISTANRCFFETNKKPAFYYAPGQSSANWVYNNPGVGDVFTIQGHSTSPGCLYKGSRFYQGDNWEDGCDFNCTCDDEQNGHYSCNAL